VPKVKRENPEKTVVPVWMDCQDGRVFLETQLPLVLLKNTGEIQVCPVKMVEEGWMDYQEEKVTLVMKAALASLDA